MAIWHSIKKKPDDPVEAAVEKLRELADPLPIVMKQVIARDATLKIVLTLPEEVLSQALVVGKALQVCAEHQRKMLEAREEGYRKP